MKPVKGGDPRRFLPTVLKGMEPQRREGGSAVAARNAKDAALFAQLVIVKWIGGQHRPAHVVRLRI